MIIEIKFNKFYGGTTNGYYINRIRTTQIGFI